MSVWLDDISRDRLRTGNLQTLIDDLHVVGVTSNPTIFAKSLSSGDAYDDQIADLKTRGVGVDEAARMITTYDIRWACDVFRPVYERTGGLDGRVSLEVDPRLAKETAKSIAEARALWWMVDRPNLLIKIPATPEGLPAITQCISEGISVNVTLIFALARYGEVIDAYMTGLEQAAAAGHDLSQIRSVASFFVSRVDTEVDRRLETLAGGESGDPGILALRGKAAVAQAQVAYQHFHSAFTTDRWKALDAKGARVQRPLWASTSTKNPAYSDLLYVDSLIGPSTVNTMPDGTLKAYEDHGTLSRTVDHDPAGAADTLAKLAEVGIDMEDVEQTLEDEGVHSFSKSFDELLQSLTDKAATFKNG